LNSEEFTGHYSAVPVAHNKRTCHPVATGFLDTNGLGQFLQQVTSIKVNVLREFTDEEVRGDNTFSIFLQQCDGLLNGIQLKIMEARNEAW